MGRVRGRMIADILGTDRGGEAVLLVEVKALPADERTVGDFLDRLSEADDTVAFGMLVDPESIRIYTREASGASRLVAEFGTVPVIRHYVEDFTGEVTGTAWMLEHVMAMYTEGWLRDLIFSWKQGEPPQRAELARIGLLDLLDGGDTRNRRLEESADPLR